MHRPNMFPSSATARRRSAALASVVVALFALAIPPHPVALAQAPSGSGVLLQAGNLVYSGAFRLPAGSGGLATFDGGGNAMSFDASNNTLWMSGLSQQWVAEVNIPAIRTGTTLSDFETATYRTPFRDVLNGTIDAIGGAQNNPLVGGTLPWLGDLIVSAYIYFDAGNQQTKSHFRVRGSTVTSPSAVGTTAMGMVGGWMTPIPAEWQGPLGGPALTGQCCIPIINRTSSGPAASVFNPADVGVKNPVPAKQVVGYPFEHQAIGTADTNGTLFNSTVWMGGLVFPAGTRSVLFIGGRKALAPFCYGEGQDDPALHNVHFPTPQSETKCYDPVNHDKGTHGYPYAHVMYAYDANDLVAVKNGSKQPWQVLPYATWQFDLPLQHGQRVIAGVAYDPATKRLFVTAANGDGYKPLVHVFTINNATAVPAAPAPPQASTPTPPPVSATPPPPPAPADTSGPRVTITAPAAGATVSGSVSAAASASDDVGVVGVQFTLDGANLGPEYDSAPYHTTWATSGTSNGSHILRAIARDEAGNATSSAVTITVNNVSTLGDTTAPVVWLVSPAVDATVSSTITLSATALDNVGVAAVQFTLNGASLGAPVGAPYQMSWATSGVANGTYTLKAVARDTAGNSRQSAGHKVTVANVVRADDGSANDGRRMGDNGRGTPKPSDPRVAMEAVGTTGRVRRALARTTAGSAPTMDRVAPTSTPTSTNTPAQLAPLAPLAECQGDNPFASSAGQIGVCANGQWTLVQGLRTWGIVRQRTLATGVEVWVIETDEALYEVQGGLGKAYQKEGLEILFEARLRPDVKSALAGALMTDLQQISVP